MRELPKKLALQKKRKALLFLEKLFPFSGRLNQFDRSTSFEGRFAPHHSPLPGERGMVRGII